MLVCESQAEEDSYIARNPRLIAEVTSPNTEAHDRGFELRRYQKIPSLQYYLLISQSDYLVDVYGRQNPTHSPPLKSALATHALWTYRIFEGKDAIIDLEWLDLQFSLSDLYQYVHFSPPDED